MGISKTEAAERQLDAAIRLFFANDDWIAVHTLAAASGRILRDLTEQRGSSAWERLNKKIIPEKRKYVWGEFNKRIANFLKHADQDPDALLEGIDPLVFADLQKPTRTMCAFGTWYTGAYPDMFLDQEIPIFAELKRRAVSLQQDLPRAEQLALWQAILKLSAE